ncbi:hypothetical protein [Falsibacillus albus]|uniref:Uncharacterized protein n=1 Tax=Falsibacillus albus TaxID=2478915 RepID=A0A3L7K2F5_9BACI|nr:hypothetical protein [Falsibacillus albus]RLQ96161.1 hypothetical protein D9X91_07675 [Falsibacillus albus]
MKNKIYTIAGLTVFIGLAVLSIFQLHKTGGFIQAFSFIIISAGVYFILVKLPSMRMRISILSILFAATIFLIVFHQSIFGSGH